MEPDPLAAFYPAPDRWLRPVLEELDAEALLGPDARVLEIGCGRGRVLFWMQQRFPACSFLGIDVDPERIAAASAIAEERALERVSFVCADITAGWAPATPAFRAPWTLVLLHLSLHDLGAMGPTVLRLANGRLARDGRIVIVDIAEYIADVSRTWGAPDPPDAETALISTAISWAAIHVHRAEHVVTAVSKPRAARA